MKKGDYGTLDQARKYHSGRFENGMEIINRDEMNILNNWLKRVSIEDKKVLDLGTGTGRVLNNLIHHKTKKIYALDRSDAMLKFLRNIYSKEIKKGDIEVINSTSDKIPLDENSLDLVTSFHLFKHLRDINPTLKQVNKVLKPGGYFIFDILNSNSLIKFGLGDCYGLSRNQIEFLLGKHGFIVRDIIDVHPLGETIFNYFGKMMSIIPKTLEAITNILGLGAGTKIFILAQKNG